METGNQGFKDAENKAGITANMTARQIANQNKKAAALLRAQDVSGCEVIKEKLPN